MITKAQQKRIKTLKEILKMFIKKELEIEILDDPDISLDGEITVTASYPRLTIKLTTNSPKWKWDTYQFLNDQPTYRGRMELIYVIGKRGKIGNGKIWIDNF